MTVSIYIYVLPYTLLRVSVPTCLYKIYGSVTLLELFTTLMLSATYRVNSSIHKYILSLAGFKQ